MREDVGESSQAFRFDKDISQVQYPIPLTEVMLDPVEARRLGLGGEAVHGKEPPLVIGRRRGQMHMRVLWQVAVELVFRTLYRGFCLLRTEYGFCGLPAPLSGLRDGCNGHGFAPIGSEPC
jgi:hypothetical protein